MSMRAGGPTKGAKQWLLRKYEPLRSANLAVRAYTREIVSIYRVLAVAIAALPIGIYLQPAEKKVPVYFPPEAVFSGSIGGQELEYPRAAGRLKNPSGDPARDIARFLQEQAPSPLAGGPRPERIVLRGIRPLPSGKLGIEGMFLPPPPGAKIFFTVGSDNTATAARAIVNGVSGEWLPMHPAGQAWSAPLTAKMLGAGDEMIVSIAVEFAGGSGDLTGAFIQ